MIDNVIYLDLETTGLYKDRDEIIELGAVKIVDGEVHEYHQLVNPSIDHIPLVILDLCKGLKEEDLRKSPSFDEIKDSFLEFIGDYPLICHNARFEKGFLEAKLGWLNNIFLDSLELFVIFKPHFPQHNLNHLIQNYLGEDREEEHRALEDALDTRRAVEKLMGDLCLLDADLLEKAMRYMEGTTWNWLPYLKNIPISPLRHTSERAVSHNWEEPTAHGLGDLGLDDMGYILRDQERWRKHLPSYEFKEHQLDIAQSIIDVFEGEQALFLEAPTGSGKTLPYLAAAFLWSHFMDEKVFISTNTKNLQQQIQEEMPKIAGALGLENFRVSDLKGISNYACRSKIDDEVGVKPRNLDEALAKLFLYCWSMRTSSGELQDISYWFRMNNKYMNSLSKRVHCRKENCAGDGCEQRDLCFYWQRVDEMRRSSVCTINHSLLLTWPWGFPEIKKIIIDEAHSLEEKARESFSDEVSSYELGEFCSQLRKKNKKSLLNLLKLYCGRVGITDVDFTPAFSKVEELEAYNKDLSGMTQSLAGPRYDSRYGFHIPISHGWKDLEETILRCANVFQDLGKFILDIAGEMERRAANFGQTELKSMAEEYYKICEKWAGDLKRIFHSEDGVCRHLKGNEGWWSFHITPLDVAEVFHERILKNNRGIVLTSGTLAQGGSYDKISQSLGFHLLDEGKVQFLDPLPPMFDYANNSVLALPQDSPGYKSSRFPEYFAHAVYIIAKMLGGRTMVLFSNRSRMTDIIRRVSMPLEKMNIRVYDDRYGSKQGLIEKFREDRRAVLFGSKSFYEGVDIKGPALSCVIIEKLDFRYRGDPILSARCRDLEKQGLNPFT
ncbi:MAG: DEAD/DEAH box helicase, partial [Clostridia bacterium]|nr:DEAD/DEAH box helicase [Clostridia bacterium]